MKNPKSAICGLAAGSAMLVIILDTKTAILSVQTGLLLCIRTVIPSLFPFFVLSGIINSCLLGQKFSILQPLRKFCKIPKGGESLLLIGFLAGYPVGAQLITQAYRNGNVSRNTAHRMLGFCNNAGPAFIFGMLSPLFANSFVPWVIWGIHIASALMIGCLLPSNEDLHCSIVQTAPITLQKALQSAIRNMTSVCGWVIIFRVIIGFCTRWFFWWFPEEVQVLLTGFLELANGVTALSHLSSDALRFVFSCVMLAFGGLCVGMQTLTVTDRLGSGYYFPGKVAHCLLSTIFSLILYPVLFKTNTSINGSILPILILSALAFSLLFFLRRKKVVAFARTMLYNIRSSTQREVTQCCSERK